MDKIHNKYLLKIMKMKNKLKKWALLTTIIWILPLVFLFSMIISWFLLAISIYSSLSNSWLWWNWLWDDWLSWVTAWNIAKQLYKNWYDSQEALWFPSTWYFSISTFKKHFVNDRALWFPSTAIDFWYDPSINEKSTLTENIWDESKRKKIKDYDYSYLKMWIVVSNNWPKKPSCRSQVLTSRKPPVPVYSTHNWVVSLRDATTTAFWNSIFVKWEKAWTLYAHLYEVKVQDWQEVKAWELLWIIWNTWNSCTLWGWDWHHLHYEMLSIQWSSWITWDKWSTNDHRMKWYMYVTQEVFMQNLLAYWWYQSWWLYKWDHVWMNVWETINWNWLNSNNIEQQWDMAEFLNSSVEWVKKLWFFSQDWSDFFSKLLTWTILWRENSSTYNKDAKINFYILAPDWWAWIYQSQHVKDPELLAKYKQWWWYNWEDWDWLWNWRWQWCWVWTEWRRSTSYTTTKQWLINRWCDLERDVRFDKNRVFEFAFSDELRNKNNICNWKLKKLWLEDNDFNRWLCIIYAYNAWNSDSAFKNHIINFRDDVTKWTNHFEQCISTLRSIWIRKDNTVINCSYAYQYALNYVLMKEKWATQLDWLKRFQWK